jgi:mannose-6-phosphate isomerase-like protein (cupin superfamily)
MCIMGSNTEGCGCGKSGPDIISKEDAKLIGQKWYFTGEPCKNGHVDKRYVNTGVCYVCKRNLNRKQNKENIKLTLTCKKCQNEFHVPTWEKDRLYCSKKCQLDAVRKTGDTKTTSNCKICGNEFKHYGERIVCSRECLSKYMSQQRLNENNPVWIDNKEKKICVRCGNEFEYTRRNLHKGQERVFCSLDCSRNNGNNKEFNNNNGNDYKYPREFNGNLKNKIKERDGKCCQLCGSEYKLEIHHIDYNKSNNTDDNLITVCKKCHNITNFNRHFWIQVFTGLNSNSKIIKKGWGLEIHLVNNDKYCLKYLVFFKGKKFSWHKHKIKQELWFCMWGKFECILNTNDGEFFDYFIFKYGDKIEIKPELEHQLMALSNSIIVEVSTTDYPEDSIRIEKGD